MFIVDQERRKVTNVDNVAEIYISKEDSRLILATIPNASGAWASRLGVYETPERAAEVFKQMLDECFASPVMVFQNIEFAKEAEEKFKDSPFLIAQTNNTLSRIDKVDIACWYMPRK